MSYRLDEVDDVRVENDGDEEEDDDARHQQVIVQEQRGVAHDDGAHDTAARCGQQGVHEHGQQHAFEAAGACRTTAERRGARRRQFSSYLFSIRVEHSVFTYCCAAVPWTTYMIHRCGIFEAPPSCPYSLPSWPDATKIRNTQHTQTLSFDMVALL